MSTTQLAGKRISTWGESPIWWNYSLYYVDIEKHQLIQYRPTTQQEQTWNIGERIGFAVPTDVNNIWIIGTDTGLYRFNLSNSDKVLIADPESDKPNNRFNDGKCAPDGYLFAGTISLTKETGDAQLYCLDKETKKINVAYPNVTNSNGIIWNLTGDQCYYIDTPTQKILIFDYADGVLSNPQVLTETIATTGSPDGMTIDNEGNLWVAFCHGSCVVNYNGKTGELIKTIDLPCLETTAVAFGGDNLATLYITTGIHKTEVEESAGRVLSLDNLGVTGVPAAFFALAD